MSERARLIATLTIWIVIAIIMGSTLTSSTGAITQASGIELFAMVLVMSFAAMISTLAIWLGGGRVVAQDAVALAKQKRVGRARIERLIEKLDDDEIYDLEALLLARDQPSERNNTG